MVNFFGGKGKGGNGASAKDRTLRPSRAWGQVLTRMRTDESLRVLDVGPTSPGNINFITALGHSIYLANLVDDASRKEWQVAGEDGAPGRFDVDRFLANHLHFSGRGFDIVLLWDTLDYLPAELLEPVIGRIHGVMAPGGQVLTMFHAPPGVGQATAGGRMDFCRYHLTESEAVEVQRADDHAMLHTYSNRQIEKLFSEFKSYHFFLGKDNLREVLVTR